MNNSDEQRIVTQIIRQAIEIRVPGVPFELVVQTMIRESRSTCRSTPSETLSDRCRSRPNPMDSPARASLDLGRRNPSRQLKHTRSFHSRPTAGSVDLDVRKNPEKQRRRLTCCRRNDQPLQCGHVSEWKGEDVHEHQRGDEVAVHQRGGVRNDAGEVFPALRHANMPILISAIQQVTTFAATA